MSQSQPLSQPLSRPVPLPRRQAFSGLWVPIVSPFRDGRVDLAAAQRLVEGLVQSKCRGVIVCGTTGEAATMSLAERRALLDAVTSAARGRLRVAIGVGGNDTRAVAAEAAGWSDTGVDALLISAPAYTRPSQAGIRAHFEAILAAGDRPIIVYNVPYRTGVDIDVETVRALAEHPRIVAIKESTGERIDRLFDLIHDTDIAVLCGEDKLALTAACLGAHGAILAAANVRPDLYVRVAALADEGRIADARALFARLMPLIRLLYAEPNPSVIKAALAHQGLIADELRLPMVPASAVTRERLIPVLEDVLRLD
ncbi:MAG: 4-hydroxy-tetrahydrodipicolinate synthase [Burkholderiaceae bacterium]